ncbi:MAG: 1,6-anhydro-N-acetylmuramyl-L-alanine amidase AmpD [Burkholderiales bacterium]|nr:1,6-anhydro-N-acetylmuramyl-L-alanine amidase AmpD [Burkholderiales bacterium]
MLAQTKTGVASELQPIAIDAQGWCTQALVRPSPNFGPRPDAVEISLLVIHNISLPVGEYRQDHVSALFQNRLNCDAHPDFASLRGLQVSSHFLIRRDGQLLQYVSCLQRAWHAGVSELFGRQGCNDFSIGIELEGCDTEPFEAAQYQGLTMLTTALLQRYPITHIAGHSEIASGRKTDPGPCFDWSSFLATLPGWEYRDN